MSQTFSGLLVTPVAGGGCELGYVAHSDPKGQVIIWMLMLDVSDDEIMIIREDINRKNTFSFGHCPNEGGGVYPCPNFLALFQEVHFWSIKRAYFFKNANVLNF